jgi:Ran GTPase-activating protein (RanGAP) involved in mRNA processing and transport
VQQTIETMDSQAVEEGIGYEFSYYFAQHHNPAAPETLRRLSQNDPDILCLNVDFYDDRIAGKWDWSKEVGRAIGKSNYLRSMRIAEPSHDEDYYDDDDNDDDDDPNPPRHRLPPYGLPSFFIGLAENRSIEELDLNGFNHSYLNVFTTLAPFFECNTNLRSISMRTSVRLSQRVPSLISALVKTVGLKGIDISESRLEDSSAADIINALRSMPGLHHLVELHLGGNRIGQQGCAAIRKLLRHPACKIQCLCIEGNNLDDVCMDILYGGLVSNTSIKWMNIDRLRFVTSSGWGVFFDVFSNSSCSLERIDAHFNHVGDAGAISLGGSFATNRIMKRLNLHGSQGITQVGWRGFSEGLGSPNCSLLELSISDCDINDEGALAFALALGENNSLVTLDMAGNRNISSSGWIDCLHILRQHEIRLQKLDLSRNKIDDLGATLLVTILVKMSPLVSFKLLDVMSISADGWREFADVISPRSASKLHDLRLGRGSGSLFEREVTPPLDDSVMICFSGALIGNTSLSHISMRGYEVSEAGRRALANCLCDKSSLNNTFYSNHTMQSFCYSNPDPNFRNSDLFSLLGMNKSKNKAEVARKKILATHFGDDGACVRIFAPMATHALPTALSWIGRDRSEYSIMYLLLRSMSWPL